MIKRRLALPVFIITDVTDQVGEANYFKTIDLKSGCYQVNIDPADVHKTAVQTPYGLYEYARTLMGYKSGSSIFSRFMSLAIAGLDDAELFVYLDDICVYAKELQEHGVKFRRLMRRLDEANLAVEPQECKFLRREAFFLGFPAGNSEVRPDLKKVKAVRKYPIPTDPKRN